MVVDWKAQTVLITGASSGIGRSFAMALASRGANLVVVARRVDRLEALAADLRARHRVAVETIAMDLSPTTAGEELLAEVNRRAIRVTSLINNAGFGTFGPFTNEDFDRLKDEIAVNASAPVLISRAFLPQLLDSDSGFLINVASMAAYTPIPRMAVYGASKAFILSFTEALWAELRHTGLVVFALSPGATSTEFNQVIGTDDATSGSRMRSADDVVATAFAHLARRTPGPSVIDGRTNRLAAVASRFTTRRLTAIAAERLTDPQRRASSE